MSSVLDPNSVLLYLLGFPFETLQAIYALDSKGKAKQVQKDRIWI